MTQPKEKKMNKMQYVNVSKQKGRAAEETHFTITNNDPYTRDQAKVIHKMFRRAGTIVENVN